MQEIYKPLFTPWKIGNVEIKNRINVLSAEVKIARALNRLKAKDCNDFINESAVYEHIDGLLMLKTYIFKKR